MAPHLPEHGRVACVRCYPESRLEFDVTRRAEGDWRTTWNPLSWGSATPEVLVLGFSKGPTQAGALATVPHDEIAYRRSRTAVGKILGHVGLVERVGAESWKDAVDRLIGDRSGRFHFASLIRCTVERFDRKSQTWTGTGGGMLDRFVGTSFGRHVTESCARQFLEHLPSSTRLVVMFGYGSRGNYVSECRDLFSRVRPGAWRWDEEGVSYADGKIAVVHVEHFAAQGALIPQWLGEIDHPRGQLGLRAQAAVARALTR
jgi:hypothetical protein